MDALYGFLLVLGVIATMMIVVLLTMLWNDTAARHEEQLIARLGNLKFHSAASNELLTARTLSAWLGVHQLLSRWAWPRTLDRWLVVAGYGKFSVGQLLLTFVLMAVTLRLVTFFLELNGWLWLLVTGSFCLMTLMYLRSRVQARILKFEKQLPEAIDFIARAMRAGHAFGSAIQMAATESDEPIAGEFARAQAEINFGVPMARALGDLAERIGSADMRFFAVAVMINREVGGDLASLLDGIATLVRERVDMRESVYAMTAEGRLSALILGVMPFLMAGVLMLLNPAMMLSLWESQTGRYMVFAGLSLMVLGVLWMRSMVRIKI